MTERSVGQHGEDGDGEAAGGTAGRPDGPRRLASLGLLKYANVGSLSDVYRKAEESASPPTESSVVLGKRRHDVMEDAYEQDELSPEAADLDGASSASSPPASKSSENDRNRSSAHNNKPRRSLQRPKLKGTACTACRKSKLKCDEEQPCAPCQKRRVDCVRDPGVRMYRMLQEHLANTAARAGETLQYGAPLPASSASSGPFVPTPALPVEHHHQHMYPRAQSAYHDSHHSLSRTARQHVPLGSGVASAQHSGGSPYPSPVSSTMSTRQHEGKATGLESHHAQGLAHPEQRLPSMHHAKQETDGSDDKTAVSKRRSSSSPADAVQTAPLGEPNNSPRFHNILNDQSNDFPPYLECWRGVLYEAGIDNMVTLRDEIHLDMVKDYVDFLAEAYPEKIASMTQRFKFKFALEKALRE